MKNIQKPNTKVTAGAASGALVILIMLFIDIPDHAAVAATTAFAFVLQYMVPNK